MKAFGYAVSVLYCLMQLSFLSCLPLTGSNFQDLFKGQSKCLNDFSTQVRSIVDDTKARSLPCLNAADVRFQVNEKIQLMQKLSIKCSLESNIKDYFECVKNIAEDNRKLLNDIAVVEEIFTNSFAIIEQKKQKCLASVSAEGKLETEMAGTDLRLCLHKLLKKEQDPSARHMEDFLKKLDIVKEKYESFKDCVLSQNHETCWKEDTFYDHKLNETMSIRRYFLHHFSSNSSDYFKKITDIDLAENSCLRQYITKQLSDSFEFDMESCIKFGLSSIEDSEENYEKDKQLIQSLIEIEDEFKKCRQITKDLDTYFCILRLIWFSHSPLVKDVQQKTTIKPEKAFKKLKEFIRILYSEEYPCLEDLYATLRFKGFYNNNIEKSSATYCFFNGHQGRTPFRDPSIDEVLADLQSIQYYIKNCTIHPESPGFVKCFKNAFWINHGH